MMENLQRRRAVNESAAWLGYDRAADRYLVAITGLTFLQGKFRLETTIEIEQLAHGD